MKRIVGWLLVAMMCLPGVAVGTQQKPLAPQVAAPPFSYHTFGTEAGGLVSLQYDRAQLTGGLFVLEEGYLSTPYEVENDVVSPHPAGKPLTCLNSDLSVRWVLKDERLTGAWYTSLLELSDALLLGSERSSPGVGLVYSLLMIEKDTGVIRWQREGLKNAGDKLLSMGPFLADENGNILVSSNGDLSGNVAGTGALSLLSALDGSVLWAVEYPPEVGIDFMMGLCPLGDGWLLYGIRKEDRIVLYADAKGLAQGYFTFQPWAQGQDYTSLWLVPASQDVVYLSGWEMEGAAGDVDVPYRNRTMYMMRITKETFAHSSDEGQ